MINQNKPKGNLEIGPDEDLLLKNLWTYGFYPKSQIGKKPYLSKRIIG